MSDFKEVAHRTVVELFDLAKEQQAEIKQLKTQLNNMESCYIQIKKINDEQSEIIQGHFAARNELQKRVDAVLKKLEGDLMYVEQDQRKNFEFLQMAMIRCLRDDIKALRGEHASN